MNNADATQGATVVAGTVTAILRERWTYQAPTLMRSSLAEVIAGAGGSQYDQDFTAATFVD